MKPLRIPLRVVFYREDGWWIAHCLEFDLVGHGETRDEALRLLGTAIAIQVEQSLKHDNPDNLFSPAEGRYFAMFAAGSNVAAGEFRFGPIDSVEMESVETREYLPDGDLQPA